MTERMFECKELEYDCVKFTRVEIDRQETFYIMHQTLNSNKLTQLYNSAGLAASRSLRHRKAWLRQTRPELWSHARVLSLVTPDTLNTFDIKFIITSVRKASSGELTGLIQHDLDRDLMPMLVLSNSSFASNQDSFTQLGFVNLLTDKTRTANWMHYASYKGKRIV